MKLGDYLDLANLKDADFAKVVGVSDSAVQFWRSGDRTPRKTQMQKIFEATNGAVTPNDFITMPFRDQSQGTPRPSGTEAIAQETEEVAGAAQ